MILKISDDLELPLSAVTQKFAWLGRSGSGKTYACKRFVEQMLAAQAQVVVLDSVGVWFGLRQGHGFDVPVLGGLYGDIPLDPSSGAMVAELAVRHLSSMVLDLSQMSDAGRARFAAAFGARLFELKKARPAAMHVVLDEGQDYVPQNPEKSENQMLHEWVRIAKQGRAFGIGLSIVSQRPQEISKKALNQAECVVAFQLTGPQERKALEYWLADKGLETKLSTTLTTLEVGRPFVWSPQWLKISKVIERVLPIVTADTSQTPEVGGAPRAASAMKPIDLGALRVAMESLSQQAQDSDPKFLRERVKQLEAQLARNGSAPAEMSTKVVSTLVGVSAQIRSYSQSTKQVLASAIDTLQYLEKSCHELQTKLAHRKDSGAPESLSEILEKMAEKIRESQAAPTAPASLAEPETVPATKSSSKKQSLDADAAAELGLSSGVFATLSAISQKKGGATRSYLVLVTGLSRASIETYVQKLVSMGLVSRQPGKLLFATAEAFKKLPKREPLPSGKKLVQHYINELSRGHAQVFREVAEAYPQPVQRSQLVMRTGLSSASVETYVQYLVTRGLLERCSGKQVRLHQEFDL